MTVWNPQQKDQVMNSPTVQKVSAKILQEAYDFYLLVYDSRLAQMSAIMADNMRTLTHEHAQQTLAQLNARIVDTMMHAERRYLSTQLSYANCNDALRLLESAQRIVERAMLEEHVRRAKDSYERALRNLSDWQSHYEIVVNEYLSADSNLRKDLLELPLAMWKVQFTMPRELSADEPGPKVINPVRLSMDAFKAQLNIEASAT